MNSVSRPFSIPRFAIRGRPLGVRRQRNDTAPSDRNGGQSHRGVQLVCAVLMATLITGCGFQLRGKVALAPALSPVAVAGNDGGLMQVLRESISFSGAQVTEDPNQAASVVRLLESGFRRDVRTTDTRGLATSYLLVYSVRFDSVDRAGKTVMKEGRMRITRDLNFNANQVLQMEEEQRFLVDDMRQEISQNILRRLSAAAGG